MKMIIYLNNKSNKIKNLKTSLIIKYKIIYVKKIMMIFKFKINQFKRYIKKIKYRLIMNNQKETP